MELLSPEYTVPITGWGIDLKDRIKGKEERVCLGSLLNYSVSARTAINFTTLWRHVPVIWGVSKIRVPF